MSAAAPARLVDAHALALLANPYGWKIVPMLWEHIAYGHYNKLDNFDHASLSFSKFSLFNFGSPLGLGSARRRRMVGSFWPGGRSEGASPPALMEAAAGCC
jgi:hypothetical protein